MSTMRKVLSVFFSITLAVSLMPLPQTRAYADPGSVTAAASGLTALDVEPGGTVSGGEVISADGAYTLADNATGSITVSEGVSAVVRGNSYDSASGEFTKTYTDLGFALEDGAVLTLDGVAITLGSGALPAIDVKGSAILKVSGTNMIDRPDDGNGGYATIHVGPEASATFDGDGILYGYKFSLGSYIGSNTDEANGAITFKGGTYFLKGSKTGAIIGSDSKTERGGTITVDGGSLYLKAVARGALMGGSAQAMAPNVIVNGGLLEFFNDFSGSAIGNGGTKTEVGGGGAGGTGTEATLTVNGGSIKTVVGQNAYGNWGIDADANKGAVVSDATITAAHDTSLFTFDASKYAGAEKIDVYLDGAEKPFYSGGLYQWTANEVKDPKTPTGTTMDNWVANTAVNKLTKDSEYAGVYPLENGSQVADDKNLYFQLTRANHTLVVNGDAYKIAWNDTLGSFVREGAVEPVLHDVTVDEGVRNGTVSVEPTSGGFGSTVTVNVAPDAGYRIKDVTYQAASAEKAVAIEATDGVYSFTMPAENVVVSAAFEKIPYKVAVSGGIEHGSVTVGTDTFTVGDTVIVDVKAEAGYRLQKLVYTNTDETEAVPVAIEAIAGVRNFEMPAGNVEIAAKFTSEDVWDGSADTSWYNATDAQFALSTPEQLAGLAQIVNSRTDTFAGKTIFLENDMLLNEQAFEPEKFTKTTYGSKYAGENGINFWTPIANAGTGTFSGTLDGRGHMIRNLFCGMSIYVGDAAGGGTGDYAGLFSYLEKGGVVKNLGVSGYVQGRIAGGIVGSFGTGGTGANPQIANCVNYCYVRGDGSGSRGTGGILGGERGGGTVANCVNLGTVYNDYRPAGGIVGIGTSTTTVANCMNVGSVYSESKGDWYGAIIDNANNAKLLNNVWLEGSAEHGATVNRTQVDDGKMASDGLKAAASQLGFAYRDGSSSDLNGGYPLLFWQAGEEAADFSNVSISKVDGAEASSIPSYKYMGSPIKPALTLAGSGYELVEGVDYTVSYGENVEVGEASVVLTGIGAFDGATATYPFSIEGVFLADCTIAAIPDQAFTGSPIVPELSVTYQDGDKTVALQQGVDYSLACVDNVNVGEATATIVGSENIPGDPKTVNFNIVKAKLGDCAIAEVGAQQYTGKALEPAIPITLGDYELVAGKDYIVAYFNNVKVGTATARIFASGDNFTGNTSVKFTISDNDLSQATMTVSDQTYTGKAITPRVQVVSKDGDTLVEGVDYKLSYENNVEVGTASVTATGIGTWGGTIEGTFDIIAGWDGAIDISWYDPDKSVYHLSTPAQLAGVAALVDGMLWGGVTFDSDKFKGNKSYIEQTTWKDTWNNSYDYHGQVLFTDKTIVLDNDIDMGGVQDADGNWSGPVMAPIGGMWQYGWDSANGIGVLSANGADRSLCSGFAGTFDGNGHYVKNLNILANVSMNSDGIGLIGSLGVSNNVDQTVYTPDMWPGAVVVRNLGVTGHVEGGRSVGGIVGRTFNTIKGNTAGSWPSGPMRPLIENCVNYAEVSGYQSKGTGGVVGASWNHATVSNCYNMGYVHGGSELGGIVGCSESRNVNLYNAGKIAGNPVSYNNGGDTYENVYYLEESGTVDSKDGTKVTSDELKALASKLGSAYRDDVNDINGGYPVLFWQNGESGEDLTQATVANIPAQKYTGAAITGVAAVTLNGRTLVEGSDYSASYSDNTNVTADGSKAKLVSISGMGLYSGVLEVNKEFVIEKGDLADATIAAIPDQWYDGDNAVEPALTVRNSANLTLAKGTDYEVTYRNNTAAGTAFATITGKGNYTGTNAAAFTIRALDTDIAGSGTAEDPYQIGNDGELEYVAQLVNAKKAAPEGKTAYESAAYKIMEDFEATGTDPIGNNVSSARFAGSIDGNGKTITLHMTPARNYSGLIGYVAQGTAAAPVNVTVKNLTIAGDITTAGTYGNVAAFIGNASANNSYTTFENCVNKASVTTASNYAGGFTAQSNVNTKFVNCRNEGAISGNIYVAGFSGYNGGSVSQCANTGVITAKGSNAAGFFAGAYQLSSVESSYNSGAITATANAGGIAGQLSANGTNLYSNVYNTGNVKATNSANAYAGGIIASINNYNVALKGAYNSGKVEGATEGAAGAIVGFVAMSGANVESISDAYWLDGTASVAYNKPASSAETSVNAVNVAKKSEADFKSAEAAGVSALLGASFAADSKSLNGGFPVLFWQNGTAQKSIAGAAVNDIADQPWTGAAIYPAFTIELSDGTELAYGSDFTATFADNVNVARGEDGTVTAGAKVTSITGIGAYQGTIAPTEDAEQQYLATFKITPKDMSTATISDIATQYYAGVALTPAFTVTLDTGTTLAAANYDTEWKDNDKAGTASVTVTGKGNYTGSVKKEFTVLATTESLAGAGTEDDPYQIATKADLAFFAGKIAAQDAGYLKASYKLKADIDATDADKSPAVGPIGGSAAAACFQGTFDGDGHAVKLGLAGTTYQGLFAGINAATVKNLTVRGSVSGTNYLGGIAGVARGNVAIENCSNEAAISGTSYVGGLVGQGNSSTIAFSRVVNKGAIEATSQHVGGIIGQTTNGGTPAVTIDQAANTAKVKGGSYVGGIVGNMNNRSIVVTNAYNTGDIEASASNISASSAGTYGSGGIIGRAGNTSTVSRSYNSGSIAAAQGAIPQGAMVGYANNASTVTDSYYLEGTYSAGVGGSNASYTPSDGAQALSADELKAAAGKLGSVFSANNSADGYPVFFWQAGLSQVDVAAAAIDVADQQYAASAVEPALSVTLGGKELVEGVDYTVVFSDNVEIGTAKATVSGKGLYTGSADVAFDIVARSIDTCAIETIADQVYTGLEITPTPAIANGSEKLAVDEDFIVLYDRNTAVGTADVIVVGQGNYTGEADLHFAIVGSTFSQAGISAEAVEVAACEYTGSAVEPDLKIVNSSGVALAKGTDYLVKYSNNVEAGPASATIVGRGAYSGVLVKGFEISQAPQTIEAFDVKARYGDAPFAPAVALAKGDGTLSFASDNAAVASVDSATGKVTVNAAGEATITVSAEGTANYAPAQASFKVSVAKAANPVKVVAKSSKQSLTFKSSKQEIKANVLYKVEGLLDGDKVSYSKKSGAAGITVTSNGTISVSSGLAAKSYDVVVIATAGGDANHAAYSNQQVKITIAIAKAANPLVTKAAKATVKYSKVKSAKQTVSTSVIKTKGQGAVTYAKKSVNKNSAKFSVDKKTGKITVAKGTPSGTYKVTLNVTAAGNGNYKNVTKTAVVTVNVKK